MPVAPTLSSQYFFSRPSDPLNGNLPQEIANPNLMHIEGISPKGFVFGSMDYPIQQLNSGEVIQKPVGFVYMYGDFLTFIYPNSNLGDGGTSIVDINSDFTFLGNYYSLNNKYYDLVNGQLQLNQYTLNPFTLDYKLIHTGTTIEKAVAFNDAGAIVGITTENNKISGFIRYDGPGAYYQVIDFSPFEVFTRLTDINNKGSVAGFYLHNDNTTHSFIYDQKSGQYQTYDHFITNLSGQSQRSTYTVISSINDAGNYVGVYNDINGKTLGFAKFGDQVVSNLASNLGLPPTQNKITFIEIDNKGHILFDTVDQFGDTYHYISQSYRTLTGMTSTKATDVYYLYQAAFDRLPDSSGLIWWADKYTNGQLNLNQIASAFISSAESKNIYGDNPSNEDFVINLYNNTLHRNPDSSGLQYWLNGLENGMSRDTLLIQFALSTENVNSVSSHVQNGYWVL